MQNPRQYKIPDWFLNRQKDIKDGKYSQVWEIAFALTCIVKCVCFERLLANFTIFWFQILANNLESKLREDLERLKKIRAHRGLRHYWG